jgi:superfamily I DNA and/or RNA helicase
MTINTIPISKQIEFFNWQLKELHDDFASYLNTPMKQHFANRESFKGKIHGVDKTRGNLMIEFDVFSGPRINTPYECFLFGGVNAPENINSWSMTYEKFRSDFAKLTSSILPIFYLNQSATNKVIIGCKDLDIEYMDFVEKLLEQGKKPTIIIARKDPPYQYLINLKKYVEKNPTDKVINTSFNGNLESWIPDTINDRKQLCKEVINKLNTNGEAIIQGPPGTGKSTLISEVVTELINRGNSICITALTNKALMEIADKDALKLIASAGKVYKTNLTLNELKDNSYLKKSDDLTVGKSELLLATYYKLSDWFHPDKIDSTLRKLPVYDVLIIEEASQSFLTTIAAFKRLGSKILIVGDPIQLPPIILNENLAPSIHPLAKKYAQGLISYVENITSPAYMLQDTYRLSVEAALQTSIFYNKPIRSIQVDRKTIHSSHSKQFLDIGGATKIKYLPILSSKKGFNELIDLCKQIVSDLDENNVAISIAILSPFKKTVLSLQESLFQTLESKNEIIIETIDRIQGLTVDFCIVALTLDNPTFALDLNRINVATSRAKSGTLIITDKEYVRFKGINPKVTKFLNSLNNII